MSLFNDLWQLLRAHGSSAKRETECAALWSTYPPQTQQRIYDTIRTKLEQNKFVHYDPLRAIGLQDSRPSPMRTIMPVITLQNPATDGIWLILREIKLSSLKINFLWH